MCGLMVRIHDYIVLGQVVLIDTVQISVPDHSVNPMQISGQNNAGADLLVLPKSLVI
jgi:hypothetical protein